MESSQKLLIPRHDNKDGETQPRTTDRPKSKGDDELINGLNVTLGGDAQDM